MSLTIKPEGIKLSLNRPLSMADERNLLTTPIDFNIYLGVALKAAREAAIYSVKHISDISYLTESKIRKIEAGSQAIKPNDLYLMCKLYGCETYQIMFLAEYLQSNGLSNYTFDTTKYVDLLT